jgi:hypothetical protein
MGKARASLAQAPDPNPATSALAELLSRRQVLQRASVLGIGGLVLSTLPVAERILERVPAASAATTPTDGTLQAFADTMVPGRKAALTDLGNEIHPKAIAGAHSEPGAVQTDALLLYHHPLIGFDAVEAPFLADLEARSLLRGGQFLDLPFDKRVAVCVEGLGSANPNVQLWELAAAVPFAAFLAEATQKNATIDTASGYQVMGHPGTAPNGYAEFSYRRRLSRERTLSGNLP